MLRIIVLSAVLALAFAEAPAGNYGAPSGNVASQYGAPAAGNGGSAGGYSSGNGASDGGYSNSGSDATGFGGVLGGGMTTNIRAGGEIESEKDLELENEGLAVPSDIIGQDLLDRVVDALSEDLAQQEAARRAAAPVYGPPAGQYGAPSSGYGAPGGNANSGSDGAGFGRIQLLIPPDPLKAKLIANYIQRTTGDYVGGKLQENPNNRGGGYADSGASSSNQNAGGYSGNQGASSSSSGGYSAPAAGSNQGGSEGYSQGGYQG